MIALNLTTLHPYIIDLIVQLLEDSDFNDIGCDKAINRESTISCYDYLFIAEDPCTYLLNVPYGYAYFDEIINNSVALKKVLQLLKIKNN